MKTAKVVRTGRGQSVRLPHEYQFKGDTVYLKRTTAGVLLIPARKSWSALLKTLKQFTPDFMADREQPSQQRRRTEFP